MEPTRSFGSTPSSIRGLNCSVSKVGTDATLRAKPGRSTPVTRSCATVPYDLVGNLDADVSFDEEFFAFLLKKFGEMPELGVAGTLILDGAAHYDYRFTEHQ